MADWREATVAEIAVPDGVVGGPFGSELVRADYLPAGVPVIRGGNLGDPAQRFNASDFVYVSPAKADELSRNCAIPGDIVVTQRGTLGQVGVVPDMGIDRFVISQSQMRLRCDTRKSLPLYAYYWLSMPETVRYIHANAIATGVPHINLGFFRAMRMPLAPIHEQRRIVRILGSLDDKIELNRQMSETLEAMARALFKSFFVDFDPVRAKQEGRAPYGMDAETSALFPEGFEDSELGPIPKGWSRLSLADTGKWISGGTPSMANPAYWGGDIPWLSAKALGDLWLFDSDAKVTALGADNGTRRVPERSVVFIVRGMSLAKEWRIGMTGREVTINQDLKAIVDDGSVVPELLLLSLLSDRERIRARADEAGHGTKRLPTEVLHDEYMVVPPRPIQDRLAAPMRGLLDRARLCLLESQTLAELRDTLLPKLISGELRLPEASDLAESALAEAAQ